MRTRKSTKASLASPITHPRPNRRSRSGSLLQNAAIEAIEARILFSGYTLSAVASFPAVSGGAAGPNSTIVQDSAGDLLGADDAFGANSAGEIFEVQQGTAAVTTVASFDHTVNGDQPEGAVTLDENGNLFGTTSDGGPTGDNSLGTVFEMASGTNAITVLAYFDGTNDGGPDSNLVMDGNGNLFGTANSTVFEVPAGSTPGGLATTVANFSTSASSVSPSDGIVIDANGDIFGTDAVGGDSNGDGTVWEYQSNSNAVTTLDSFDSATTGSSPNGLTQDANGDLFGSTNTGGTSGDGTVWEMQQGTTTITTAATFDGTGGINPVGGVIVDDTGDIYGVTQTDAGAGNGIVYEIPQGSSTITTLASFPGTAGAGADGANPDDLIFGAGGVLYGTTNNGGANGQGAIFELTPVNSTGTATDTDLSSNTSPTYGHPVTFTATVIPASGTGETGTVQFMDGVNDLGNPVTLSGAGAATYTTSALSAGRHSITAVYSGDSTFNGSTSPTLTAHVGMATLTVTAANNSKIYGQTTIDTGTISGTVSGDTITATFSSTGDGSAAVVGTYPITDVLSDGGSGALANYSVKYVGANLTVAPATPTITVTDAGGVYSGSSFPATATVTGVSGPAAAGLEGVTPTLAYYSGTTGTGTALAGAPVNVGTYTAVASFPGSTDYAAATGKVTFSITGPTTVIHAADDGGVYTGNAYPATGYVANSAGTPVATPVFTYYNSTDTARAHPLSGAPSAVGNYFFVAAFAGNSSYAASTTSAKFSITKAATTIHVANLGGAYTGKALGGTIYVANPAGASVAAAVVKYYAATDTAHAHPLSAPSAPGKYVVVATYAGNSDYLASSATVSFSITIPVSAFTASTIHYTPAVAFKGIVALFTTPAGLPTSDFTATINWGDGTTSTGTVATTATAGKFEITGTHTWAKAGTFATTITLTPVNTTALSAKGSAT